jgi:hypothetical protein
MYYEFIYENSIMKPVEIVVRRRGIEGMRENDERGESN